MDDTKVLAANGSPSQPDDDELAALAQLEMELRQWEMVSDEAWAMIDELERQETTDVDSFVVVTEKPKVDSTHATQ